MKIIIVEDNEYKSDRVKEFLLSINNNVTIDIFRSYSSGLKAIVDGFYNLAILDMSLPTFDDDSGSLRGEFRVYGGIDIARKIKRRNISLKFIFLTQYTSFSYDNKSIDLKDVDQSVRDKYPETYAGCIYYEHAGYSWKDELRMVIEAL
ncbi:response regulator [Yersinia canariae]|uniref:Response regulator n=1 Tax=Yersinia canariae TaxID=2607663 RepID=A0A857EX07_9GAMM|nr:hypothetical protein [Yersinia canariae]QHB31808.1 response regulator [Yersinia canariae]